MSEINEFGKPGAGDIAGRIQRAPEIESLADLPSREDVRLALAKLGARYGKVGAVTPLPDVVATGTDMSQFIVEFDRAQDAMAASSGWRCPLFGFSAVIVSLKRNGAGERSG